jgi:hypothetical protein
MYPDEELHVIPKASSSPTHLDVHSDETPKLHAESTKQDKEREHIILGWAAEFRPKVVSTSL